jgi:hypothetical protein
VISAAPPISSESPAMLTRIGLARIEPTRKPWTAVMATPNRTAIKNAANTPNDKLARKISAEADTVAPRQRDMMLPVSVMKVMPTATQPMSEMALSNALMLSGEMKPGVPSAKAAIVPPATMRTASTRCRARAPRRRNRARSNSSLMPRPDV